MVFCMLTLPQTIPVLLCLQEPTVSLHLHVICPVTTATRMCGAQRHDLDLQQLHQSQGAKERKDADDKRCHLNSRRLFIPKKENPQDIE